MKKPIILLVLTCFLLSVCLLPATEILAAQTYLRIEDFWNYSFNQYAANLPWQFQQHQTRYFNLYWVGGSYNTCVYCIDMLSSEITYEYPYDHLEWTHSSLNNDQIKLLSAALCYGKTGGYDNHDFQVATQLVVWLITTGGYASEAQVNAVLNNYCNNASVNSYMNSLWNNIRDYWLLPSFVSGANEEVPVYDMYYDGETGLYTVSLTDTNGVLEKYTVNEVPDGVTSSSEGNTLTLSCEDPAVLENALVNLKKTTFNQDRARVMYMYRAGYQEMAYQVQRISDPRYGNLYLRVAQSTVTITKESEDGETAGFKFMFTRLTDEGGPDEEFEPVTVITGDDGTITQELPPGTYVVEEVELPPRYIQPEPQTVTIERLGEQKALIFLNKTRDLYMSKTSEDGILEGLEFKITCEALQYETTIKTDSTGCWSLSGLEPGTYTIEEINVPDQYVPMEAVTVTISAEQETYNVTAENILKRGEVEVNKKDAMFGKNLANVRFGIYTEDGEFVQEVTTNGNGVAVSGELTYGNYYLKELEAAPGYKVNETQYEFSILEDGCYEIVAVEDDPRIGTVTISYSGGGGNVKTGSIAGAKTYLLIAAMWFTFVFGSWSAMMSRKKKLEYRGNN